MSSSLEPAQHRASDQDRDAVAETLSDALAAGRLTVEEHAERLDLVYRAQTVGELVPLTSDLPAVRPSPIPANPKVRAVFSKVIRGDEGALPAHSQAVAVFGVGVLDLRQVELPAGPVTIVASSYFGKIEICVPHDARVVDSGFALFGKRALPGKGTTTGDGPLIHLLGRSMFGKLRVTRGP
ncbi:MAG: DUF1707 SHOCT-like domain-containing protein [Egibacteraceae bacterium]